MAKNPELYCADYNVMEPIKCLRHRSLMLRRGYLGEEWNPDRDADEAENSELSNSMGPPFLVDKVPLPTWEKTSSSA